MACPCYDVYAALEGVIYLSSHITSAYLAALADGAPCHEGASPQAVGASRWIQLEE